MSVEIDAPEAEPSAAAPAAAGRRRLVVVAFGIVVLIVVGVAITDLARSSSSPLGSPPAGSGAATSGGTGASRVTTRMAAIQALLARRSDAVVHHDRAAFVATVDPADPRFRRSQGRMLSNLRRVHFASWSYAISSASGVVPAAAGRRYHDPTWAPATFTLQYRIAGFDRQATDLQQYPTFVERHGRWYLGSLHDFASRNEISATDLWDYAPVHFVRRRSVLVLGPAAELPTMAAVADIMQAAVPKVDAVWGRHWARRVVVLVPSTEREMARITDDHGDLSQIAALTSSEAGVVHGRSAPVGNRVTVNPINWPQLGTLGASIVLTHELTHVATRAVTGRQTPKWLSEGFADYVGFRNSGVEVTLAGAELATSVRDGRLHHRLPSDRAFRGSNPSLSQAYESGWLACRYIADRFGQRALVRLYRVVGTSGGGSQRAAVSAALHRVLGLTLRQFTSRWRGYVVSQLG